MATTTSNYGIRKPESTDTVNVELDIAQPLDDIDGILAEKADTDHAHAEYATDAEVTTAINNVIDAAPGALNTLNELAAALGDDANFASSVTTSLAGKSDTGHAHPGTYEPAGTVATHTADTTAVHGIDNTALLITAATHALIDHDDLPGIEANIPIQTEAPADPELHDLWVDEDEPAPSGGGGGGAAIAYQPEAPDSPAEGDLWADSDETTPSGNSLAAILPLDIAPVTPHAKDDEFSGSSLDVKWTIPITSAAGGATTATVSNGWVTLESSAAGTGVVGQVIGIRQNCPTGSFTVSAKITTSRPDFAAASPIHGIFVARRTATAKGHTLGVQPGVEREVEYMGVTTYSETAQWSDWDGLETNIAGYAWTTRWLRFTWDAAASTLYSYFSSNGVGWQRLTSRTSMAQPEVMGIMMYERVGSVGADQRVHADWFRVTEP